MSNRWWFVTAFTLFVIGLVFGLVTFKPLTNSLPEEVANLKRFTDLLESSPQPLVFLFILLKNVSAVLFSFFLSPFFFLVPVLALLSNGWILGVVSVITVQEKSLGFLLAGVLPHGVIELPALFLGEAVALNFGAAVMLRVWGGQGGGLGAIFRQNLRSLRLPIVLLLLAAVIEAYVTPLVLRLAK